MDETQFKESCRWHARRQAANRCGLSLEEYETKIAAGLKWCGDCKGWVNLTEFAADKSRASGYSTKCKHCTNKRCVKYWAEIRTNPVKLERKRSRERRCGRRSGSYKRAVPRVPAAIRDLRFDEYNGQCAYCSRPAATLDHIIAVSKGGTNAPWNIVPACRSCNSSKINTDLFVWIDRRGLNPNYLLWEQIAGIVSVPG